MKKGNKSNRSATSNKKRSTAVKASWEKRGVRAARSARHNVRVGGEEFRSVAAAFDALKLPLAPHQRVRRDLVLNGRVTHAGKRFVLAPRVH